MDHHLDIDQLEEAHKSGESSFLDFVEPLRIGVGVYDSNAHPTACNKAAYTLLGLSKEQFMGNSAMDPYWKVTHEDGSLFETRDFPIIQTITSYEPVLGVIMGVTRPLQDRVWLEVNAHPIKETDGSILHVFCTYKDISDKY